MNILVHEEAGYTGRDRVKAITLTVSILDGDKILVSIPAKLVQSQLYHYNELIKQGANTRFSESIVIKHMHSNFLSFLHLVNWSLMDTLKEMNLAIEEYLLRQPRQVFNG